MKPLAVDLFSGLGGWAEGLESEGYDVIRVDIEDMFLATGTPKLANCHLILQDVLTIHGSQFKHVDLIVSSSPCQKYSYMSMPFSRGKALAAAIRADETGEKLKALNELFDAQFRIQRECNEARAADGLPPVPMVVENVRGAQPWVGPARWVYGSYALWGDVPALMPEAGLDAVKVKGFRLDGNGSFQTASVNRTKVGSGARSESRSTEEEQALAGSRWFNDGPRTKDSISSSGSGSAKRKIASAKIAKIPFALSSWIAKAHKPQSMERLTMTLDERG